MTEAHDSHGHEGHSATPYYVVGAALGGFTAVSFIVNSLVYAHALTAVQGFLIILSVAVVKAALVVIYFMHLKQDYRKVGFLIVPAIVLGCMMMFVLMPDTVQAWQEEAPVSRTGVEEPSGNPKADN
jgi:caa(3)-type oxidase subunit IV